MRNTHKTQFSTADVVNAAQAHDAVVEATLTAVCAAVAVLHDWADFIIPRRTCPGGYDYAGHDCNQSPECQSA